MIASSWFQDIKVFPERAVLLIMDCVWDTAFAERLPEGHPCPLRTCQEARAVDTWLGVSVSTRLPAHFTSIVSATKPRQMRTG
ncbi:hypothetical protein FQZ97_685840 [compost metagenome]